jgi:hypothetical protein
MSGRREAARVDWVDGNPIVVPASRPPDARLESAHARAALRLRLQKKEAERAEQQQQLAAQLQQQRLAEGRAVSHGNGRSASTRRQERVLGDAQGQLDRQLRQRQKRRAEQLKQRAQAGGGVGGGDGDGISGGSDDKAQGSGGSGSGGGDCAKARLQQGLDQLESGWQMRGRVQKAWRMVGGVGAPPAAGSVGFGSIAASVARTGAGRSPKSRWTPQAPGPGGARAQSRPTSTNRTTHLASQYGSSTAR